MDLSKMTTATKILLGAGLVLFIDLFLDWQQASVGPVTVGQTGWHGVGVVVGLLVIALLVWEGLQFANVKLNVDLPVALSYSTGIAVAPDLAFGLRFFAFVFVALGAILGLSAVRDRR